MLSNKLHLNGMRFVSIPLHVFKNSMRIIFLSVKSQSFWLSVKYSEENNEAKTMTCIEREIDFTGLLTHRIYVLVELSFLS